MLRQGSAISMFKTFFLFLKVKQEEVANQALFSEIEDDLTL